MLGVSIFTQQRYISVLGLLALRLISIKQLPHEEQASPPLSRLLVLDDWSPNTDLIFLKTL